MKITRVAALVLLACAGCAGARGPQHLSLLPPPPTTTSTSTSTTTTTEPTTSTTSVSQAIGAVLGVTYEGENSTTIGLLGFENFGLSITNKGDRKIAAWQAIVTISATDSLGRPNQVAAVKDCANANLAAGQTVAANMTVPPFDANDTNSQNINASNSCSYVEYQTGPSDSPTLASILIAPNPTVSIEVTRVSFDDGTGIGTAVPSQGYAPIQPPPA